MRPTKLISQSKPKQFPFYLSNNTTTVSPNHSFSKRLTPNLNLTIGGNAFTNNKEKIQLNSAGTPVLKKNKILKEEVLLLPKTKSESKSPLRKEDEARRASTLKKSLSQKSTKLDLNILKNIFSPNNSVQHSKEGDRSPTSSLINHQPKSPVELHRGRDGKKSNFKDLQSAVNRLVRTCEQSMEALPGSQERIEKVKKAQEGVLIKLKKFCQNDGVRKSPENLESIFIKDKKLSEGKLYLIRSDNEKLKESIRAKKQSVNIYLKKEENIDLNASTETLPVEDNLEDGQEKTTEELKKIVIHQQRVIASLKQREKVMKKALNLIQGNDLEIIELKNIDKPSSLGDTDKKESLRTDDKSLIVKEIDSLTEDQNKRETRVTDLTSKNRELDEETEEKHVDGEKQVSLIRDSKGESGRLVAIKGTTLSAKSTADSTAHYSTRKSINKAANRSLSTHMKSKLMLDFTILGNTQPIPISNKDSNNYNSADKQNMGIAPDSGQPCFHDEFMSRLDEFSFSWRQAAMNQRKI